MTMCPKCGKVLEDGMRFCDNCGAQIPEPAVCPNCGESILPGYAFCQKCGAPVGQVPNTGYAPNPGAGYVPDPNAGYTPTPGTGYVPDPNAGYTPTPGTGYAPDPSAGYAPNPGTGYAPDPSAGYAPNPGTGYAPDPNAGYAPNPGTGYAPDPNAGYTDPAAATAVKQKKPIPKKALIFGGIGVAAVALIAAVIALIVNLVGNGGNKTSDTTYMFYLRDKEIVYLDLKNYDKLEVTSRLLSSSVGDYNLANSAYVFGMFIAFNNDNSRIFYPDRTDFNNAEGVTLYYRNMKKTDEEPVKIDSDITGYAINGAGTLIIYNKGNDGTLYRNDFTNKDKIASNVEAFSVSDDCSKVLYLTEAGDLYLWTDGGDKTKVASEVSSVRHLADDLSVVYYTKRDSDETYTYSLYKQQLDGSDERVKIGSEIYSILKIYESGEMYYIKAEEVEINLLDYVNDDKAASDEAMTARPVRTDFPYPDRPMNPNNIWSTNYSSYGEYPRSEYPRYRYYYDETTYNYIYEYITQAEYDALVAQYNIDLEAYNAEYARVEEQYNQAVTEYNNKQNRDRIRSSLVDYSFNQTEYTLYYYNGTEETVVTDALSSPWSVNYASDAPALLLPAYDQSEVSKVKISEVESVSELRNQVREALYSKTERYIAVKATLTLIDQPDADNFRISYDGSTVCFLDDISEDYTKGDLYRITIEDGQVGRPALYDSDVSTESMFFLGDNRFVYYKDVDESNWKGDLYIDKVEIDYDARLGFASYTDNAVFYYTDWNSSKEYGTLKKYEDGTKTKIADDVHSFVLTGNNDILYLYDYSSSSYKGTLYRYNNGEPVKIDDDVMATIPVSGGRFKGYSGW